MNWNEGVQLAVFSYVYARHRDRKNSFCGGNEQGECLGKWWYGDLAGESVSHCLSGLSPRNQVSLMEKKTLLKNYQIKSTRLVSFPSSTQEKNQCFITFCRASYV